MFNKMKLILPFISFFAFICFNNGMVHNNLGDFNNEFWRADGNNTQNQKCQATKPCFSDNDCQTNGTCVGNRICECTCGENAPCTVPSISFLVETLNGSPQSKCGGLKNACNETTNKCECEKAYKLAGFANLTDAIERICAPAKSCASNDDCQGMTCLPGTCHCPIA
ncbi:unnamed protein product [Meloidogyne enterolobii]|uniref:Uncharacterized protein n=1 Tax=Meloidogyne enterolobii TaxID=390850 RepID=A0ACB1AXJ6_MELEN